MTNFNVRKLLNYTKLLTKICLLILVGVAHVIIKCKGKMRIVNIVVVNRASLGFQNRLDEHQYMYILPDAPTLPLPRPCHDRKYAISISTP